MSYNNGRTMKRKKQNSRKIGWQRLFDDQLAFTANRLLIISMVVEILRIAQSGQFTNNFDSSLRLLPFILHLSICLVIINEILLLFAVFFSYLFQVERKLSSEQVFFFSPPNPLIRQSIFQLEFVAKFIFSYFSSQTKKTIPFFALIVYQKNLS